MASTLEEVKFKRELEAQRRIKRREELLSDPDHKKHGTVGGYALGCRCERCRAAKKAKGQREYKAKREREEAKRARKVEHLKKMRDDPKDERHGTIGGYNYGCRCERCKAANREYSKRYHIKVSEKVAPAKYEVCTIAAVYVPMMGKPSVDNVGRVCAICGKPATDKHHIVKRSAGKLVVEGHELSKPTIRLCGMGNTSGCHGLAHQGRLHFKWMETESQKKRKGGLNDLYAPTVMIGGHWEYIITKEPCDYITALGKRGWKRVGGGE